MYGILYVESIESNWNKFFVTKSELKLFRLGEIKKPVFELDPV